MKIYPSWDKKLKTKKYCDGTIVLEIQDEHEKKKNTSFTLNNTGADIIQLIDGSRTYEENYEVVRNKVDLFMQTLSIAYGLNVVNSETANYSLHSITEMEAMFPTVVTLELTNRCNIRCLHCYGDYGEIENKDMDLNDVKRLLYEFNKLGIHTLELTGGEISIYRSLKEVLLYALQLDFEQISFLSNGIALTDEIMNIIIDNKERFFVQIDVHSLDDDYLYWFTKAPKTMKKIQKNIIKLAEKNVRMRTATIITRKNLKEIEEIADWVHNYGISHFGISPVLSLGRAMGSNKDLYLTADDMIELENKLQSINKKYPNFISIIDSDRSESKNCGALTSHCVISSNGDVKICTMDNLEYLNSSIGNVLKEDLMTIYKKNADYVLAFFNMPSPKLESQECINCENIYYCSSCVLRGLIKAKEMGENCSWYKNKIPKLIKEKLFV